mmetsp:Transcript_42374/g.104368  ORF Transcript_42374/g.104368 Transcript_42374/m.104368 type:complete len:247 (-) Transcript_42374:109-849(-)
MPPRPSASTPLSSRCCWQKARSSAQRRVRKRLRRPISTTLSSVLSSSSVMSGRVRPSTSCLVKALTYLPMPICSSHSYTSPVLQDATSSARRGFLQPGITVQSVRAKRRRGPSLFTPSSFLSSSSLRSSRAWPSTPCTANAFLASPKPSCTSQSPTSATLKPLTLTSSSGAVRSGRSQSGRASQRSLPNSLRAPTFLTPSSLSSSSVISLSAGPSTWCLAKLFFSSPNEIPSSHEATSSTEPAPRS